MAVVAPTRKLFQTSSLGRATFANCKRKKMKACVT
jgi:hypothetical protein